MTEPLFFGGWLTDALRNLEQRMNSEIDSLDEDRVLNSPEDDLVDYFIEKYRVNTLQIDKSNIEVDPGNAEIDVSKIRGHPSYGWPGPINAPGTRMTYYIPFAGDSDLFKLRPSTQTTVLPRAEVRNCELVMVYEELSSAAPQIPKRFSEDLSLLEKYLAWSAKDIVPFNASLCEKIPENIKARREKILKDREIAEQSGFALRKREDAVTTYITPKVRRTATAQLPPVSTAPHQPEPTLALKHYEHILSVILSMGTAMERDPNAYKDLVEESLRHQILVQLNGHYEGQATGETFNGEGKTDILVREKDKNIFIAECKFWRGAKGILDALDQLQSYTTWRDAKTALIVFNRNTTMTTVLEKIPQAAKTHPNYKSEELYESETGFRYIFRHRDDPERDMLITVLVFNLPN